MKKFTLKILNGIKWIIWEFIPARLVWEKIRPPIDVTTSRRKPVTFVVWVIGIWVAFFGVASQRYENRIDIIENRANAIFAQLGTVNYKQALSRIPIVQKMACPIKPDINNPKTFLRSLFSKDTVYIEIVDQMKETIETWKGSLYLVNLDGADLSGIDLSAADFKGASLRNVDFSGANLSAAKFNGAILSNSNLSNADLSRASFRWDDLFYYRSETQRKIIDEFILAGFETLKGDIVRLKQTNLRDVIFIGADLRNAEFGGIGVSKVEQLSKVKTLYGTLMDSSLMENLRKDYPNLFEKPD